MNESPQYAPERELLLATHDFPCAYVVKAFGPGEQEFRLGVKAAISGVMGDRAVYSERQTRSGRRVCISAVLDTNSVDEIIAVYEALHALPQLRFIL